MERFVILSQGENGGPDTNEGESFSMPCREHGTVMQTLGYMKGQLESLNTGQQQILNILTGKTGKPSDPEGPNSLTKAIAGLILAIAALLGTFHFSGTQAPTPPQISQHTPAAITK